MAFYMPTDQARFTRPFISKFNDLRVQVYFTRCIRTRVEIHSLLYLQDPVVQMFYYVNVSLREDTRKNHCQLLVYSTIRRRLKTGSQSAPSIMYSISDIESSVRCMDSVYEFSLDNLHCDGLDYLQPTFHQWVRDERNYRDIIKRVKPIIQDISYDEVSVTLVWLTQKWTPWSIARLLVGLWGTEYHIDSPVFVGYVSAITSQRSSQTRLTVVCILLYYERAEATNIFLDAFTQGWEMKRALLFKTYVLEFKLSLYPSR
jgi:hypothetical protein